MKRLFAILMGCMLITGTFASCGSGKDSSDSEASTKSSSTTTEAEDGTEDETEDGTEEGTEAETTTKKTTTKKVTTAPATDDDDLTTTSRTTTEWYNIEDPIEPDIKPEDLKGGDIKGSWRISEEDAGVDMIFEFRADGIVGMGIDITDDLSITGNKVIFSGVETSYEFDGKTLKITDNDGETLIMERTEGSGKSTDGKYKVTGGTMAEDFSDEEFSIGYLIKGSETYAFFEDAYRYTTKGNELTMTDLDSESGEEDTETDYYGITGDTLTVLGEYNDVVTFRRIG